MKIEIHGELINYLTTILEELCIEKNQETNVIDELARHQSQTGYTKKCLVCQTSNIDNKKRICPTCNNNLPTVAEIDRQFNESPDITNTVAAKSQVIYSRMFGKTQSNLESEVYTPQLSVPDPIGINPNSVSNVRKV